MATIGLKIAQDPDTAGSLSLADTLAKATFGDPEGQMKARALASEVGVRMASRDKLLADTGLVNIKTKQEQALADAQDAAAANGPTAANAAANANALPVEAPRPSLDAGGYGPQPGIVDPNVVKMRDAIIAQNNAEWPVIVRSSNGTQLVEAGSKLAGAAALEGGLVPGARVDPNVQRVAGGLYTGSAPTTSTVWSPGDTAGVDAAAREKIAEDAAKPDVSKTVKGDDGQIYSIGKDATGAPTLTLLPGGPGPVQKAPEHFKDAAGNDLQWDPTTKAWIKAPGASAAAPDAPKTMTDAQGNTRQWDPLKGTWELAPGTPTAPPKLTEVGPNAMVPPTTPDGVYTTPKTDKPVIVAGPYDDLNSPAGRNEKIIRDAMTLVSQPVDPLRPNPLTPQIARDYDQAFTEKFGAKTTVQKLPNTDPAKGPLGVPVDTPVTEYPSIPNFLSPTEMYKRAGVSAPPAQTPGPPPPIAPPVAGPAPVAPVPNPLSNATVVGEPTGPVQTPTATAEQSKDRRFAGSAAFANKALDKFTPDQIPGVVASMLAIPKISGSGFMASLGRANLPDKDKEWARNALEFTAAVNYEQSGAAVNADEWENAKQIYIPMPNDKPKQLADKAAARRNWMQNAAKSGWSNDPKGLQDFMASLDQPNSGGGGGGEGGAAPSKAPQAMKDAWSHMTPDAKARAVQRYGAQ